MIYRWFVAAAFAFVWMTVGSVNAAVTLFDFETDAEIAAWKIRTADTDTLKRSEKYVTSGKYSLEFHTPEWKMGMEEWPAFETVSKVSDWREYDRLVIDITNPTDQLPKFMAFINDTREEFRQGYQLFFDLPSRGSKRFVVDLKPIGNKLDMSKIGLIHFFTERPKDLYLYLDNITLLKPGEKLPPLPPAFVKETLAFMKPALKKVEQAVAEYEKKYDTVGDSKFAALKAELSSLRKTSVDQDYALEMLATFQKSADDIVANAARLSAMKGLEQSCKKLGISVEPMLIGFADSMTKVLPRDCAAELYAAKSITLSAARNEKESIQVAVTPSSLMPLRDVRVSVTDLRSSKGDVFSSSNINCEVVGFVETVTKPPYPVSYVGWWPDPILDFIDSVDIRPGDIQTFLVRVRVPKGQAPGTYKGTLAVSAYGADSIKFGFTVKVRSFTMPDCTPIPTAITMLTPEFKWHIINDIVGTDRWHAQVKYDYADFLSDYYMDFDSLYDWGMPDFDILKYKHDKGQLVAFNYGYFSGNIEDNRKRFDPIYEKAKELGMLDQSYIYGYDEVKPDQFQALENASKALKEAYPEVLTLTTAYDNSYGMDSIVKSMDGWTPLTPSFDMEKASKARAAGKKVWWYICCAPLNPFANWLVEYDAIESRLLMGAMTAKYKPDGFLYYSLCFWNDNKAITEGPFTKWNPVAWTTYHGDGSMICYGEGGKLIPTIRLENYRDGMEDTAYALVLEDIIGKYEAKGNNLTKKERSWLVNAKKALVVPEGVVKDLTTYTRDPKALRKWRDRIADMIDSSGMSDADPWGKNFGVRGFENK